MKKFLKLLFILLLTATCFLLYSRYISTSGLITNEIKIKIENLDNNYNGFKIIHLTDIHYGRIISIEELKKIVEEINNNKPDIVVFTGDFFDKDITPTDEEINNIGIILNNINTTIGIYIIKGDNDSDNLYNKLLENTNFIDLNDNYKLIYKNDSKPIIISGISSNITNPNIKDKVTEYNNFLVNNEGVYRILLIHEPDYINSLDLNNYDLILAGHSLGGQIVLPFIGPIMIKEGAKNYYKSAYKIIDTKLYISSGLGTEDNNFRFNNRPSINFYRLVNE